MKPSAFRIERLLAKVEAEVARRGLRARRYAFHPDEVAEAEAQGLPYALCTQGFEQAGMAGAVCNARGGGRVLRALQRWAGRLHSPRSARCSRSAEAIGGDRAAGEPAIACAYLSNPTWWKRRTPFMFKRGI